MTANKTATPNTPVQKLALMVLAKKGVDALLRLSEQASSMGNNITEARGIPLGDRMAVILLANGTWDAIARFEQGLDRMAERLGIELISSRVQSAPAAHEYIPYAIDVSCADRSGVLSGLVKFLIEHQIIVMELSARSYPAAHTATPLFSVQATVGLPKDLQIAPLREEFIDFCDSLNLDAILEPIKSRGE